jgi:hypothetical protein
VCGSVHTMCNGDTGKFCSSGTGSRQQRAAPAEGTQDPRTPPALKSAPPVFQSEPELETVEKFNISQWQKAQVSLCVTCIITCIRCNDQGGVVLGNLIGQFEPGHPYAHLCTTAHWRSNMTGDPAVDAEIYIPWYMYVCADICLYVNIYAADIQL